MENGKELMAIVTFDVTPGDCDAVLREVTSTLEQRSVQIPGFIEGSVLVDRAKSRVLIVSAWVSQHDWAEAQWDQEIGRMVGAIFEETASYNVEVFYRLATVQGKVKR